MGDFFYLSVVKDISKYIETLLEETNLDYQVNLDGSVYVINVYLNDVRYAHDIVSSLLKEGVSEIINNYFPNGTIDYLINIQITNEGGNV